MAYIRCYQCGYMFTDNVARCPNCGCPLDQRTVYQPNRVAPDGGMNNYANYSKPKNSNKWLYIVIGVLAAAVIGVSILLVNRLSDSPKEANEPATAHEAVAEKPQAASVHSEVDSKDTEKQRQQAKEKIEKKVEKEEKTEKVQRQSYAAFPPNFAFNGKINGSKSDYYFSMNLSIRDDGNVNGYFVVLNGKQEQVKLTGTYNANTNHLLLYEHDAATGRKTGYFFDATLYSSYSSGYSLTGRYKCNKPKIDWYFSAESN